MDLKRVQRLHDAAVGLGACCDCPRRSPVSFDKYNFNPDEPRDDHGRWTGDGGGSDHGQKPVRIGSTNQVPTGGAATQVAQEDRRLFPTSRWRAFGRRFPNTRPIPRNRPDQATNGEATIRSLEVARVAGTIRVRRKLFDLTRIMARLKVPIGITSRAAVMIGIAGFPMVA